jgi:hypothetical protein
LDDLLKKVNPPVRFKDHKPNWSVRERTYTYQEPDKEFSCLWYLLYDGDLCVAGIPTKMFQGGQVYIYDFRPGSGVKEPPMPTERYHIETERGSGIRTDAFIPTEAGDTKDTYHFKIDAGKVSDVPWAFWDFLPTAAELAGARIPEGVAIDGLSVVSALKGGEGPKRDDLYWELHEGKFIQALRMGDWKAVRNGPDEPVELYDLKSDPGEKKDLAAENPDVAARAVERMRSARTDSPDWPVTGGPARKGGGAGKRGR